MAERTFFDIHMHAFNLSHPSIAAFVRRTLRELAHGLWSPSRWPQIAGVVLVVTLFVALWAVLALVSLFPYLREPFRALISWLWDQARRVVRPAENLLAVLESDVASQFLMLEDCLRDEANPLLRAEGLRIAGTTYQHVVLTPLMMDFGYKGRIAPGESANRRFRYDKRGGKPIVEQVVDVFGGIRTYKRSEADAKLTIKYPGLRSGTDRIFEIYPFLALNPANYPLEKLQELLHKYFAGYSGRRSDLRQQMGTFEGDIADLGAHAFAGIKVYPPLGFDPWPAKNTIAREKTELLFSRCSERGIPVTTHGGSGGFAVLPPRELRVLTAVDKWAAVLCRYPKLKLNLAHFPMSRLETQRLNETLDLVLEYDNVYVDISCRATTETYYRRLRALLDRLEEWERVKLTARLLFGTDFSVNLMWSESYNAYLARFSRTAHLTPQEKDAIGSINPDRFLFSQELEAPEIEA